MVGPRVFIGSSTEGKHVAEHFQAALGADAEVTVWDQDIFGAGDYTMDSLEDAARASDFAVLVMTPDDTVTMRGDEKPAPRGNVLIELGLFMGTLGVKRVLMLSPQSPAIAFPSDLAGITRLPPPTTPSEATTTSARHSTRPHSQPSACSGTAVRASAVRRRRRPRPRPRITHVS